MNKQPSALGYALPLIIAIAVVGGFAAYKVSGAQNTIAVSDVEVPVAVAFQGEARWLKGQTHVHTNQSGDCTEPVPSVLAYYADAGFDFVVLTDHNHVTVASGPEGLLVIPGAELTQNRDACDPMPEGATRCAIHMNALFVDPSKAKDAFLEPPSASILDVYQAELTATQAMGGAAQLNHPNYHYTGADPELLVKLSKEGLRFIEVMNEAGDVNSDGDATHPNVEAVWDQALTRGAKLYAIASDDAHDYSNAESRRAKGESPAVPNRGYIYVRGKKDSKSIREAMERGDFYATNGPLISSIKWSDHTLTVETEHDDAVITFIAVGGSPVHQQKGRSASYVFDNRPGVYLRAAVDVGGKRALTQPIFMGE